MFIFENFATICVFILPYSCTSPINGDEKKTTLNSRERVEKELAPMRENLKKIADPETNNDEKLKLQGIIEGIMQKIIERADKGENEAKYLRDDKLILKTEKERYERTIWKLAPRVYFDDIEALFKPRYQSFLNDKQKEEQVHRAEYDKQKGMKDKYVPLHSTPNDWPSTDDPKAIRIRKYADMWYWFFTNLEEEKEIKKILVEMESAFRRMQTPPIDGNTPLNTIMQKEFNVFIKNCSRAIGFVHEIASVLIHTPDAYDLLKGKLAGLNVFGPEIDPYIVPVLNAIVPFVRYDQKPAIFENDQ